MNQYNREHVCVTGNPWTKSLRNMSIRKTSRSPSLSLTLFFYLSLQKSTSATPQRRNTTDIPTLHLSHNPAPSNRPLNTPPLCPCIIHRTDILKRRHGRGPRLPQLIRLPRAEGILKHHVLDADAAGGAHVEIRGAGVADGEGVDGDVLVAGEGVGPVAVQHEGRRGFVEVVARVDGVVCQEDVADVVRFALF